MQSILVTGAAGFIGFHVARRLLADGGAVVALDNLNSYYDPELKKARLAELAVYPNFRFEQRDVADRDAMADLFAPTASMPSSTSRRKPASAIRWSTRTPMPIAMLSGS